MVSMDSASVELFHWNPRRRVLPGLAGKVLRFTRPVNNFGDLLGPVIVRRVLQSLGIDECAAIAPARLLSIGSVLHFSRPGDVVWGTGINGKMDNDARTFDGLDVRAVRGPLTRAYLQSRGLRVPEVYGDPGLLIGTLYTREELRAGRPTRSVTIIPNLNDRPHYEHIEGVVNPRLPLWDVIGAIAASDFVVGSSLHAVVVAEALEIPARLLRSGEEPSFKYEDYYLGTGREKPVFAATVEEALKLGGEPPLTWKPDRLLAAFPRDLWQ
jgi:pyruvyltransferase